jgi:hypothetical protein
MLMQGRWPTTLAGTAGEGLETGTSRALSRSQPFFRLIYSFHFDFANYAMPPLLAREHEVGLVYN